MNIYDIAKRCVSSLLAAGTILAITAPTAKAEEERRLPSGVKFEEVAKKFDRELNMDTRTEFYAGFETIVFCGNEIIYEGYYGDTDREKHIPCSEDSVFEWGSISKTMIWVSAMQLWEQGKLDLEADIRDYLPDGFLRRLRYDQPITMMEIMDHTGGWCESTYSISTPDRDRIVPLAKALQDTEPAQVNPPGEVISYSNWGAALGAYVIECVSGMDYADYVHANIFDRLGMEHTSIAADFSDNEWVQSQRNKLNSYTFQIIGGKYKSSGKNISYINLYPCGSATGTIRDLATYAQAFVDDEAPLFNNKETQEKLLSGSLFYGNSDVPISSYGFGVEEYKVRTMGHNGLTIACQSNMLFDRESKIGLVTLTNETSANLVLNEVPTWVFGSFNPDRISDENEEERTISGYYLLSRSHRSGLMKFTSYLNPINTNRFSGLTQLGDGFYELKGTGILLGEKKRSDGKESFATGAMEIEKAHAYPAEISLIAMYFAITIGSIFILLYKVKMARCGRGKVTVSGSLITAAQVIKIMSVLAAIALIAFAGREVTYGVPKVIGISAGTINITCIITCMLAGIVSLISLLSKNSNKLKKVSYGINIAANALIIIAIIYFEMYKFWGC